MLTLINRSMELKENEARAFFRLLNHGEALSRVRCQDVHKEKGREEYVKGEDQFVEWCRANHMRGNLFVGRNPVNASGEVLRATGFSLDIDPVRPKKTASSGEQHRAALRAGKLLLSQLGDGYLLSSGNGALVYFPFDEPVESDLKQFEAKCRQFEKNIRELLTDRTVVLDATHDLSRLVKVPGSVSTKGDRELWRYARFVHLPRRGYDKSAIRKAIQSVAVPESVLKGQPCGNDGQASAPVRGLRQYGKGEPVGEYPDRSTADFALALRLKAEGLGPERVLAELGRISFRPERTDDHRRTVEKVFAPDAGGRTTGFGGGQQFDSRTQSGSGALLSGLLEPHLWTPGDGGLNVIRAGVDRSGAHGTGFDWLDAKFNGGFRPGVLYAVEAPTNGGKSTFIVQAANHLCRNGKRVLLVITEMDVKEAVIRLAACETGIPGTVIQSGQLTDEQRQSLSQFEERFRHYQLFIHYTVSPRQAQIEKLIDETKPDVLLWDYFQHFETGTEARQVQLASLARWYESIALQKEIAVVVAAQLHSVQDFKTGKKVSSTMHHIKDCKVLNDTAKVVVTLNWAGEALSEDGPQAVKLNIEKNKGPHGETTLLIERNIPRFRA